MSYNFEIYCLLELIFSRAFHGIVITNKKPILEHNQGITAFTFNNIFWLLMVGSLIFFQFFLAFHFSLWILKRALMKFLIGNNT